MDILLTIIAVIIIFSALVLVHEWGHFMAARKAGIKVLEFGIGFPPRLWKKKVGETLYTINAIPFGGFVKLCGEDSSDAAALKDPRSFASKTPWTRTKVIVAGVAMNFLLAIFLLTIGFSFGIEPLLVNEQDLMANVETGVVKTAPGAFVSKVSTSAQALGIHEEDQILAVNDRPVRNEDQLSVFEKGKAKSDIDLTILQKKDGTTKKVHVPLANGTFGIDLKPFTSFPRMEVLEVKPGSVTEKAGLKPGDILLEENDREIYSIADVAQQEQDNRTLALTILRGDAVSKIQLALPDSRKVILANVYPDSSAQKAGFQKGDAVLSMDGKQIQTPEEVQTTLKNNLGKEILFHIKRANKELDIKAKTGENKLLGVELSVVSPFQNSEVSLFQKAVLTSIVHVGKVQYNPWEAFKQAISESVRLTGLTLSAFGNTISSIFVHFQVPGDVGGPVQIAYYTHAFVQEGFFALLRFMALLSLSLAVINILPIPALDGGRFLFIILEVVLRKRVNARIEGIVHGIGFFIIIGFILLITYSDIVKLF